MTHATDIEVRRAQVTDLDALAPLFDSYRQFYGRPTDIALARRFLLERLRHNQSVILIAMATDGDALGFTQLYPSFSSVSAAPMFVLNDLFVTKEARRCGVGSRLLQAAARSARALGAVHLELSTGVDNEAAQALYESHGWVPESAFRTFVLPL